MGEEGDDGASTAGTERVEKKYCCGNCPQRESINIARLDLGVAVYELIFFGTFVVIYLLIPDYFNNYREKNQDSVVLMGFMSLSESMKVIFVGSTLILGILSLLLAILLLIAAKSKNVANLKRWFTLTIIKTLPALALDIYTVVTFFDDRMMIGCFVVFCYLYRLYSLWICLELQKEIQHVDTDFIHPMYRDNP